MYLPRGYGIRFIAPELKLRLENAKFQLESQVQSSLKARKVAYKQQIFISHSSGGWGAQYHSAGRSGAWWELVS